MSDTCFSVIFFMEYHKGVGGARKSKSLARPPNLIRTLENASPRNRAESTRCVETFPYLFLEALCLELLRESGASKG